METDVVVVGSGAAGLTTAVVSAALGLKVVLIEASDQIGGTTALSGGGVWVPCNRHMAPLGQQDSRQEAEGYLRAVLGNLYDAAKVDAFLDNAPAMVDFLEARSEMRFVGNDMPDYQTDLPGWKSGRILVTAPYDSRRLGALARRLRPPRRELMLFHSFQVSRRELGPLREAHKSPKAALFTAKVFAEYFWSRLRHGRGVRVVNGNALIARLAVSAQELGVEIWTEAKAARLLQAGGKVEGVVVDRASGPVEVRARRGVVLATGGFGPNSPERKRLVPHADYSWGLQAPGVDGDGIRMGREAGGVLCEDNAAFGIWQTMSGIKREDGEMEISIHLIADRHAPGSLMVDAATGKRFVNEASSYQAVGQAMHQNGVREAWMISEGPSARKYGIGLAKPWPFPIRPWIRRGYVVEAASLRDLAGRIGVPAEALEATVAEFNANAARGEDPAFGRGQDVFSRYHGDREHQPNPSLGPVARAPFYAVKVLPGELSVFAGLQTDAAARVLDKHGQPIEGLYAVGLDNNSLFRGQYPGGGASLGPAMTFGYVAAHHLAQAGAHQP